MGSEEATWLSAAVMARGGNPGLDMLTTAAVAAAALSRMLEDTGSPWMGLAYSEIREIAGAEAGRRTALQNFSVVSYSPASSLVRGQLLVIAWARYVPSLQTAFYCWSQALGQQSGYR